MRSRRQNTGIRIRSFLPVLAIALIPIPSVLAPADVERLADHEVTYAIESQLWNDEVVDANTVDVETQNGVVTLSGVVDNMLAKDVRNRLTARSPAVSSRRRQRRLTTARSRPT